jgi:hypothetical protein
MNPTHYFTAGRFSQLGILSFLLWALTAEAAEKIVLKINNQSISAYRTADLEAAKMDAYEENHAVLKLVDDALHTPDPHYTPPTVVFLDSEAKRVLATVIYEPDFTKRAQALAKALEQVRANL